MTAAGKRSKIAPSSTILLPPRGPGWFEFDYAVSGDGRLICLDTSHDLGRPGREPFRKSAPTLGRLSIFDGERQVESTYFPLEFDYPAFDTLPDGGWIIANARCRQGQDNAQHLAADGTVIGRFCLGDAIEHLQCDGEGKIWCGYWDEGALDNRAWSRGRPGMAPSGLMRFETDGRALWSQGIVAADFAMVDCYALNVGRRQVWSCCYTDFPILSIDLSGTHRLWPNMIEGAKAIAIDRRFGLLAGGYAEESHRLVLFRCDKHEITPLAIYDLDLGFSRERPAQLFTARQDSLHVVSGGQWCRLSVMDVALAAGVFY